MIAYNKGINPLAREDRGTYTSSSYEAKKRGNQKQEDRINVPLSSSHLICTLILGESDLVVGADKALHLVGETGVDDKRNGFTASVDIQLAVYTAQV
jgi:hypothetical protein